MSTIPRLDLTAKRGVVQATVVGRVSTWRDQSGNGHDCIQGIAGSQPYFSNERSGHPGVWFPAEKTLVAPAGVVTGATTQNWTVLAVVSSARILTGFAAAFWSTTLAGTLGLSYDTNPGKMWGYFPLKQPDFRASLLRAFVGIRYGPANVTYYDGNRIITSTACNGGAVPDAFIGYVGAGQGGFYLHALRAFNSVLTDAEIAEQRSVLNGEWDDSDYTNNLIWDGDSLTAGFEDGTTERSLATKSRLPGHYLMTTNAAVSGRTWVTAQAAAAAAVDVHMSATLPNILHVMLGTVEGFASVGSYAAAFATLQTQVAAYLAARRVAAPAIGIKIFVSCIAPATAMSETNRSLFNNWLRGNFKTAGADYCIDPSQHPSSRIVYSASAVNNPQLYYDGTHRTTRGVAMHGAVLADAIPRALTGAVSTVPWLLT